MDEADSSLHLCQRTAASLAEIEPTCKLDWQDVLISDLLVRMQALARDTSTPYRVSRTSEIKRSLKALGVPQLVDEILSKRIPARQWTQ